VSPDDTWSPDEQSGTEAFEEGDEALDERTRTDPDFEESVELDPSLDPTLLLDQRELEEVGATLDDPESMATLDGGIDDPDGVDPQPRQASSEQEGWDLDAPLAKDDDESE
jgi:hypothetical protein